MQNPKILYRQFSRSFLFLLILFFQVLLKAQRINWIKINTGLFYSGGTSPSKSDAGDSKILLLKIDPEYYSFKLICAKEKNEENRTAKEWSKTKGLIAVVKAYVLESMTFKLNLHIILIYRQHLKFNLI